MRYEYLVLEFSVADDPGNRLGATPDMERLYFPDWLSHDAVEQAVTVAGGCLWGAWFGGMFGLATNRFVVVSTGESELSQKRLVESIGPANLSSTVVDYQRLHSTVRPTDSLPVERDGFFVFRWLRLIPGSVEEWTDLCNQTWPNFQRGSRSECLAVWQVENGEEPVDELLMCTWYENLDAWEHSREVDPQDAPKWRRRAEMEYYHWGIGARRIS